MRLAGLKQIVKVGEIYNRLESLSRTFLPIICRYIINLHQLES